MNGDEGRRTGCLFCLDGIYWDEIGNPKMSNEGVEWERKLSNILNFSLWPPGCVSTNKTTHFGSLSEFTGQTRY